MKSPLGLRLFKLFILFAIPFLTLLYAIQFTDQKREEKVPFKTFRVPDLSSFQLPGGSEKAALPLREPITVVNFWATWCPPCVSEFPAMIELQRQLEGKGVELVFVSVDERWSDVEKFLHDYVIDVKDGRQFWDPDKEMAELWGSTKFPETYVIRQDGWVLEKIVGEQRWTRPLVVQYFEELAQDAAKRLAFDFELFPTAIAQSKLLHEDDKKTLETLKSNIDVATKNLLGARAALKSEERSLEELRLKLRKQEEEQNLQEARAKTLSNKSEEIERALTKNKSSLSNESSGRKSVVASIKASQRKIERLEKDLELERIKLVETQKLLSTRNQNIESLEKAREALEEDQEKLKEQSGATKELLGEQSAEADELKKSIRARERAVNRLEGKVKDSEKELDQQKAKLVEFEELLNK